MRTSSRSPSSTSHGARTSTIWRRSGGVECHQQGDRQAQDGRQSRRGGEADGGNERDQREAGYPEPEVHEALCQGDGYKILHEKSNVLSLGVTICYMSAKLSLSCSLMFLHILFLCF